MVVSLDPDINEPFPHLPHHAPHLIYLASELSSQQTSFFCFFYFATFSILECSLFCFQHSISTPLNFFQTPFFVKKTCISTPPWPAIDRLQVNDCCIRERSRLPFSHCCGYVFRSTQCNRPVNSEVFSPFAFIAS